MSRAMLATRPSTREFDDAVRLTERRGFYPFLFVVNMTGFLVMWELFTKAEVVNQIFVPAPSRVTETLWGLFASGELTPHLIFSGTNLATGVGIGAVVGIPLGLAAGSNRFLYRLVRPYVFALAALPRVAWLPLLIMIFGYSNTSKVTLIFMAAFFPMVINSLAGVRTVDPDLLIAGRVFGARWHQRYTHIVVPHAIPYIFSGFKQGLARSLAAAVVSEMFGGSQGIGYLMVLAGKRFDSPTLYAMLVLVVITALVIVRGADLLEARVAPWRRRSTS